MLALEKMTSFRQTSDREGLECLFLSQGKKNAVFFDKAEDKVYYHTLELFSWLLAGHVLGVEQTEFLR